MRDGSAPFRSFGRANCFRSKPLLRRSTQAQGDGRYAGAKRTRPPTGGLHSRRNKIRKETVMATLRTGTGTQEHKVVSSKEWIASRKELLRKEKEFTKLRDTLSRQRRELPWEKVEKQYVFDGPQGK